MKSIRTDTSVSATYFGAVPKLVGDLKYDQDAKNKALDKTNSACNTTEITCSADGSIKVALNGVVICSGKSDLTDGAIGFSDGPRFGTQHQVQTTQIDRAHPHHDKG